MHNKNVFVFFSSFLLLLICSLAVSAIGISPADAYISFVPGYEYIIDYSVTGYRSFDFYVEGPFSEFTRVETINHGETSGNFRVHLFLPQEYSTPGKHRMYVAAKEKSKPGTVNALAGIRAFVEIDVPFPGYYAEIELNANDVNAGEPVFISAVVRNRGKENITDGKLALSVLAGEDTVKKMDSDTFAVDAGGAYTFETEIGGDELKPGRYTLRADLSYAGNHAGKDKVFNVGTFDVEIVNHTTEMYNGSVNLFDIEVESRWNNPMSTVYMDISMLDGKKAVSGIKTPPFDLPPWKRHKSSVYWNTDGIAVGEYDLEIVLHYDEGVKTENRKIFIVDKPQAEVAAPVPVLTITLIIIALLLILFNFYAILAGRKRRKEEDEGSGKGHD
jgi:hypothetical protein